MSFIPRPIPKYQYTKTRFFEREHGVEYTKFELSQMKEFSAAKKHYKVEVSGYVAWSRPPYFLLLPTTTTPNGYLICKVDNGLNYPDLNQYSTIRGIWKVDIIKNRFEKVLIVENIEKTKEDFGKIKPDITTKDFVGRLFENWRNIRETTRELIAQDFVSSPTNTTERTGGFTLTLASYSKTHASDMFLKDLNRFIPKDFTKNKALSFKVPELGISANLPKFGWDDNVANIENIPKDIDMKLDRIPKNMDECSITLLQKTMGPSDFDAKGMIKSDYPIILEELVERTRVSYDVDLEVYKFILTTRLSSPTISLDVANKGLKISQEKLLRISQTFKAITTRTGDGQFLDLGHKGKSLSIQNLAISFGRSNSLDALSMDDINKASDDYIKNLDYVMTIDEMWGYDQIPAEATLSISERQVWVFLLDNTSQTINDVSDKLNIPVKEAEKIIGSLLRKSTIIESQYGKYTAVSQR